MTTEKKSPRRTPVQQAAEILANGKGTQQRNADRSIKRQTAPVEITWDVAKVKIGTAVGAEGKAHNAWITAADILWILGVRPDHLDNVLDSKGKQIPSDTAKRIEPMIVAGFTPRVQSLLALDKSSLSGLTEVERAERRYWSKRIPVMLSRIKSYLKRHEDSDRGVSEKSTLAGSIVKVLKTQIGRIERAKAEKIDFDDKAVIEALKTAIAELT